MSFTRILVSAIVGGLVVFMWGFVSHEFLHVEKMAFGTIGNAAAVDQILAVKPAGVREAYLLPEIAQEGVTEEEMKAAFDVWEKGPRGFLVVDSTPLDKTAFPKMMAVEYASGAIAALIASIVAAGVRGGYVGRVATVTLMGVFSWLAIDVSYWNWYRFPDGFAMADLIDQGVGWLLGGLVIAAIAKPSRIVAVIEAPA